ncbi:transposase family protein [Mycobacterium ulcerans str. Harvey]|uniref:Transposase family protein n=1 Tax=Mycobacterium ulcerans str. Harvey TaxID=1299332 RepID=A0ABP3AUB2_MYCUL|nr:transposase family protein [Mycobacterium ulcerans str. Harvey]
MLAQLGSVPPPSEKTFRAVLSRLDPPTSTPGWAVTSLHTWPAATPGIGADRVGRKMLRGALRAKATATHLVSVFAHRARLVLVNSLSPRKAMKSLRTCPAHAAAG